MVLKVKCFGVINSVVFSNQLWLNFIIWYSAASKYYGHFCFHKKTQAHTMHSHTYSCTQTHTHSFLLKWGNLSLPAGKV